MTPLEIARAECANYQTDGSCLGAIISDDLQIHACQPKPKCLMAHLGPRCGYFEECVLPMGPKIQRPRYRQRFDEGARQYRLATNAPLENKPLPAMRPCPLCGKRVEPRHRFCLACSVAKRRESTRKWRKRESS